MRKRYGFEALPSFMDTVESAGGGDSPAVAVLSKTVQAFDSVLLPSSPFEEQCGKHTTFKLEGFFSSEKARDYFSLLHLYVLN